MLTKRYKWFRKDHKGELVEPRVQPYPFATVQYLNTDAGFETQEYAVSALEEFLENYKLNLSKYDDYFLIPVWSAR